MPDLTPDSLSAEVLARFADEDAAQAAIDAALAAVRRYCGWHVTPEREDELVIDGPGTRLLSLPTLNLVELTSISESGVALNVADLDVSSSGLVRKVSGACWSGRYGAITVTMTHGFDDAQDFQAAVLSFIDRESLAVTGGHPRVVGPFQFETEPLAVASAFSVKELSLLDTYRILQSPV